MRACVLVVLVLGASVSGLCYAKEAEMLPDAIKASKPFSPDGVVKQRSINGLYKNYVSNIEYGRYKGLNYSIDYAYGNLNLPDNPDVSPEKYTPFSEGWYGSCSKDKMNDSVTCYAGKSDFSIWYSKRSGYKVDVGSDHFPGRHSFVRVGSGKPRSTSDEGSFSASASKAILKDMLAADSLALRYVKWPYDVNIDKTVSTTGVSFVMEYLKWAVDNYR